MCSEEKLNAAKKYIANAEDSLNDGNHKRAINNYHRAILYLKGIEEDLKNVPPSVTIDNNILKYCLKARAECHRELASILNELGKHDLALSHCQQVADIDPTDDAYYQLGVANFHLDDKKKAYINFLKAKELSTTSNTNLARYLRKCEQFRESENQVLGSECVRVPDPRNKPQDRIDRSFSM